MRRLPLPRTGLVEEQSPPAARLRAVAALGARHRRVVAALSAGGAVLVAVSALTPSPSAGNAPGAGERTASRPLGALPAAAGARAPGDAERVAVAVRLSDPAGLLMVRVGAHVEVLAGPAGDGGLPGTGNGAGTGSGGEIVAPDAVVLAVPAAPGTAHDLAGRAGDDGAPGLLGAMSADGGATGASGTPSGWDGVVLLAVPPSDALHLAAAAGTRSLSIAVGLPSPPGGAP